MNVLSSGFRSVQLYALQKANETSSAALEITAAALSSGSGGQLSIGKESQGAQTPLNGTGSIIDIKA